LEEEIGVSETTHMRPVGLVIDGSTISASRHAAFVFEVRTVQPITAQAPEEFSSRSKISGRLFDARELLRFRNQFDPWSRVLFEDYIAPKLPISIGVQRELALPSDE
jgi:predicted NUDIX family phosphoesterase